MQSPLRITFRGIDHSDAIERRVRDKATELGRFTDEITSCHVTVEAPQHRHHKGDLYSVRLEIHVPGGDIRVGREHRFDHAHEDVYVAIRDAFDAAVRQLENYARTRRGDVKRHDVAEHGRVTSLFAYEGYGFVRRSDGVDVYFHEHSVVDGKFDELEIGDEVRVVVAEGEGEKGPQASTVVPIGKHHLVSAPSPKGP